MLIQEPHRRGELYYAVTTHIAQVVYYFLIFTIIVRLYVFLHTQRISSPGTKKSTIGIIKIIRYKLEGKDNNLTAEVYLIYPDSISYKMEMCHILYGSLQGSGIDTSQTAEEYFNSGSSKLGLEQNTDGCLDFKKAAEFGDAEESLAPSNFGIKR